MLYFLRTHLWQLCLWTTLVAASLWYDYYDVHEHVVDHARNDAEIVFARDLQYRMWAAKHGGVYVPVTRETPPNPNLAHLKERDVTSTTGVKLTLLNPAYMMRQVNELPKSSADNASSHITSLSPIRLDNAANPWETKALLTFENGAREFTEIVQEEKQSYLHFMRPVYVEAECLKCHAHQGYKIGEVRGGISVTLNLRNLQHEANLTVMRQAPVHATLWCLGVLFAFAFQRLRLKKEQEVAIVNEALQEKNQELELQYAQLQQSHKELGEMQEQIVHASKLASIGTLAAGVAHEINNPLQIIKGYGQLLEKQLRQESRPDRLGELLQKQNNALERINSIVNGLRTFAEPSRDILVKVDLHQVLLNSLELVSGIFQKENIQIETSFQVTAPIISANVGKLQQVFMNLLSNAKDAIKQVKDSGVILIVSASTDEQVTIKISDNGVGMEAGELEQIFSPFYTTKAPGKGTGLGLSISHSFITSLGGQIFVESQKNVGSTFTLSFPAMAKIEKLVSGKVLVVDDEKDVRVILAAYLSDFGLQVDEALDGAEALSKLQHTPYDYVISDIIMPRLSGDQLLEEAMKLPHLSKTRFIIITGGIVSEFSPLQKKRIATLSHCFLAKPFDHVALKRALLLASR
ncbi:MAG: hypothetical protein A2X86_10595 [Bdellovibrionales bacterium GWA2_49_15]|nr:MAG: hypothetical protein A2X86_10595 [Bdellovibrionales bacterium GWA2_49_15]HAZ11423.1 hypothetical protein [Bdellovibrionales bacterium]